MAMPKIMAVQGAAVLVAAAFLVIGVLGFIPGVTTHHDQLQWAGHHSGAMLFGVFAVSGLHNVVHLAFGVVGFMLARTYAKAARLLARRRPRPTSGCGCTGCSSITAAPANFVPLNSADNWLHFGLGVGHGAAGRDARGPARPDETPEAEEVRANG